MADAIRVRPYEAADREACRDLWRELTQWHRQLYDDDSIGGDTPGDRFDEHVAEVGRDHVWVALAQGRVVGMAAMIRGERSVELEPVVVAPDWRGCGVGRMLVEAVAAAAREQGLSELRVRPAARTPKQSSSSTSSGSRASAGSSWSAT